jgi:outer membrane protein
MLQQPFLRIPRGSTRRRRWPVRAALMTLPALCLGLVPVPARAQTPLVLTVDEAVRRAEAHAPRLAEGRAREASASSSVTALKALGWPTAGVTAQYARLNHIDEFRIPDGTGGSRVLFPDIPNTYRARAEISMPLLSFGRVSTNVAAAESDVRAARADLRSTSSDVRLDATRAYWTLAIARENVRVLVQALARTDAWVGDVQARVDAGLLPPNDVLSARAARARQEVRLLQARNDASMAELDLARLIGEPPGAALETSTPVTLWSARAAELAAMPAAQVVNQALSLRSERESLTARSDGLRQAAKAALANMNPYVVGLAAIEPARPNARFVPPVDAWRTSWVIDFKLTWPIFDGGRSKAQAASLTSQAAAVEARLSELDAAIALDVRQRLLDMAFAQAAIAAADEGIAAATEARRVVEERFRAGVATSTEVLDAQLALTEAELERTRLQAGLRLTEARLLRAVGGQP